MAVGDIPASLQDTEQIVGKGLYTKSCRISDTIVAVAYAYDSANSYFAIKTYAIDSSGNIGSNLDTYAFGSADTGTMGTGDFFHITGDMYATVSAEDTNNLSTVLLRTWDIDGNTGEINLLDNETITSGGVREPSGCLVSATNRIVAIAQCTSTSRVGVRVQTFSIGTDGAINTDDIDIVEVSDANGTLQFNEIAYDAEYGYLLGGYGNSGRTAGVLWSLSCDTSGNLGSAFADTMAFGAKFVEPSFIKITTGVWTCIYTGADNKITLASFTLASNGALPASVTDSLVLSSTTNGWGLWKGGIAEVATGYYTYGYKSGNKVFVGTCTIDTNGAIGNSQLDTLAVTTTTTGIYAGSGKVVQIKSGIFGIAYEAHDNDDTPYEAADYINIATYTVDTGAVVKSAALTGTITTAVESDLVTGGETIVLTLTGDTWVASGATFNGQRQNIIDGLTSAQSEATGWNAEVRDKMAVTEVVRTSDTVVTITLAAQAGYSITANETITATIPATALTGAAKLVASPTFTITNESAGTVIKDMIGMGFIPFAR